MAGCRYTGLALWWLRVQGTWQVRQQPPVATYRHRCMRSSDGVHEVALGGIEKDSDLAGMDQAVFAAAPPEAMRGLMQVCGQGRACSL